MKNLKNVNLAIEALRTIENNETLKALLGTNNILFCEESVGLDEVVNDREDTIKDYMMECGYTRIQAVAAYNQLDNY